MELGVRDWIIIVGVLLIVVVLLDGFRRVRNERYGSLRMSLNKQFLNADGHSDEHSCELPNGGGRTVGRARPSSAPRHVASDDDPAFGASPIDLEQTVPMLMESVVQEELMFPQDQQQHEQDPLSSINDTAVESKPTEQLSAHKQAAVSNAAQQVIVINVVARDEIFNGPDLLHILLACDLRFGKMNIFHRYEQANGNGPVQFSMANSVEPGTFDLDQIDHFTTPGVCFFMSMPGPEQPIQAFEYMLETAQCLVANLNGEMLDESRSAMTSQTLEHYRQRLREFERHQLARA
jgi:cell division protein ZipA